jgi:ABC-type spermidine/putrescine transport system permease subunit II
MALPVIVYAVSVYGLYAKVGLIGSDVGLITAHTILALPYPFLTVSAAIVTMDRSLPMAAASCGASPIKAFWCVIFPIIRPSVAAGALFAFLTSFDEVVVAMFIGGIDATLPKRMLDDIRYELSPVLAAIAAVLTCLTAILIFVANTKKLAGEQR